MDAERLWRVLVDAVDVLPDAEWIDRPDWVQLRTPSSRYATHNKVLRARIAGDADGRIAEVLQEHAERHAHFGWIVDHGSSPSDLSSRLERAGVAIRSEMKAMTRDTRGVSLAAVDGLVLTAATAADAALIGSVGARGWQRDAAFEMQLMLWAERVLGALDDRRLWIAWLHGEPVGHALLRMLPGLGYLQGACVVPEARGRGIYAALTKIRLEALAQQGIDTAVVWADTRTSGPVLRRLGFADQAHATVHER